MARIAVVTPYHREPLDLLAKCHGSVMAQDMPVDHFMVADGFPQDEVQQWKVKHVVLPASHGYGGGIPRGIGGLLAESQGYDFIAFLDADNWYHPGHLASLLQLHRRTSAPVCTSLRTFHKPDESQLQVTEAAEDQLQHVDTSCFFIHRSAFSVLPVWVRMPPPLYKFNDRVFLAAVRHNRFPIVSSQQRTVAFRSLYETHFAAAGEPLPAGYKPSDVLKPAYDWLMSADGVTDSVQRLGFWPGSYL